MLISLSALWAELLHVDTNGRRVPTNDTLQCEVCSVHHRLAACLLPYESPSRKQSCEQFVPLRKRLLCQLGTFRCTKVGRWPQLRHHLTIESTLISLSCTQLCDKCFKEFPLICCRFMWPKKYHAKKKPLSQLALLCNCRVNCSLAASVPFFLKARAPISATQSWVNNGFQTSG